MKGSSFEMSDLVIIGLIALLTGAVGFLSYSLGRKVEKNADFEEKEKAMEEVRRLRDRLSDPTVVERLHEKFRR